MSILSKLQTPTSVTLAMATAIALLIVIVTTRPGVAQGTAPRPSKVEKYVVEYRDIP